MKVKEGESKGRDTHTRQTKNGTYEIVTTRTTCHDWGVAGLKAQGRRHRDEVDLVWFGSRLGSWGSVVGWLFFLTSSFRTHFVVCIVVLVKA